MSIGGGWANERVSGSDGGDGDWQHLGAALLSALIVAAIIVCGRSRLQDARAYLQLSRTLDPANDGRGETGGGETGSGGRSPPPPRDRDGHCGERPDGKNNREMQF